MSHNKLPFFIFLDIDGVFNCQTFYKERFDKWEKDGYPQDETHLQYKMNQLCKERFGWFNDLVEEIDAKVVISSTWRMDGKEELQFIFDAMGATFEIFDVTPRTGYERGTEISKWLKDNIKPELYGVHYFDFYRYAIIDDDSDMLLNQGPHFFQTDNYSGLTPNTCYKIKRFATHKTF